MPRLALPKMDGTVESFEMPKSAPFPVAGGTRNRIVYAAAHVVGCQDSPQSIDWDATLQFREHLWDCDLGVAEAMDTAQRGMGLSWLQARELIQRTLSASTKRTVGYLIQIRTVLKTLVRLMLSLSSLLVKRL